MRHYNQKQRDADIKAFQKSAKLKTLIIAAMERWTPEEMLEMMYEKCCSGRERDDLREKMIDMTIFEGGIFIKTSGLGLSQREQIEDFMNTNIFPSYNEQKANLLFYS